MRENHENRVDLYEKTKEKYLSGNPEMHPDLVARLASDSRLHEGHPDYLHSGVDRMLVEGSHGQTHEKHLGIVKQLRERDPHAYNAYGGWYTDPKWSPEYKPTPEEKD